MSVPSVCLVRRRWLQHLGLLLSLLSAAAVRAEEAPEAPEVEVEQAGAHFDRGVRFYEEGDYRSALLEFQRAYALQPAYQLLYNLGQVSGELRDYAAAEDFFRRYLVDGKDAIPAERRAEVLVELSHLATRVGTLRISSNVSGAEIQVDDRVVPDALSKPLRVSAGRRQLVAEKAGYAPVRRSVDVLGGEELSVTLSFGPELAQLQPTAATKQSSTNVLPWITGAGSAALLIAGGIMAYASYDSATEYADELDTFTTQGELDRLSSSTQNKALAADILLGAGIAAAAVTVVLILTAGGSEKPAKASRRRAQLQF